MVVQLQHITAVQAVLAEISSHTLPVKGRTQLQESQSLPLLLLMQGLVSIDTESWMAGSVLLLTSH